MLGFAVFTALVFSRGQANARPWTISAGHNLLWEGRSYTPIGASVADDPSTIEQAIAAGVTDFVVRTTARGPGWDQSLTLLQKSKCRFFVSMDAAAPSAFGYAIDPDGFRIGGITQKTHISIPLPGAVSVFAILATPRDGGIEKTMRLPVVNGKLEADINPENDLDHVLILYPLESSLQTPDYWAGADGVRDSLLHSLASLKESTGLRGIVNPFGVVPSATTLKTQFVPVDPLFQLELAAYLRDRYKNIDLAINAWSISASDITTFSQLAKLVPLWYGKRGIPVLLNPANDQQYSVDQSRSLAWNDIQLVIAKAAQRRFARITDAIHQLVDVPVLQGWCGWGTPYAISGAVDGIGVSVQSGDPLESLDDTMRATSSLSQWDRPGLLMADEVSSSELKAPKDVLTSLSSLGCSGAFFEVDQPSEFKTIATLASSGAFQPTWPKILLFPESANNPASAQSLPGGIWWLPAPIDGNRLDFGPGLNGYRMGVQGSETFVIWSTAGPRNETILIPSAKAVKIYSYDGSLIPTKLTKKGVQLTVGSWPIVIYGSDSIPAPQSSLDLATNIFPYYTQLANTRHASIEAEAFRFADSQNAIGTTPGAALETMWDILRRFQYQFGDVLIIPGDKILKSTSGFVDTALGTMNPRVWNMRSWIAQPGLINMVEYSVQSSTDKEVEAWMAVKASHSVASRIIVNIGGQSLSLKAPPVAFYGGGFAWYDLGRTRIGPTAIPIRVSIDSQEPYQFAIDSIAFSPMGWKPEGPRLPLVPSSLKPQKPDKTPF